MYLSGYKALYQYIEKPTSEDIKRYQSTDFDIICTYEQFMNILANIPDKDILEIIPLVNSRYYIKTKYGLNYDISFIKKDKKSRYEIFNNPEKYISFISVIDRYGNSFFALSLKTLYELKKSHRMIRKGFSKTMDDFYKIQDMLIKQNKDIISESEFYKIRYKETIKRANKAASHINLKQKKAGFFNTKGLTYTYDHDDIHKAVKYLDKPIYKYMLADGEEVFCSKAKWNSLPHEHKKMAVLEEAYVISIERFLLKNINISKHGAFLISLEKICTTLCKGWFRKFAYENYKEIKEMYSDTFWDKFQCFLQDGRIRVYEQT